MTKRGDPATDFASPRRSLLDLFNELIEDGMEWVAAELALSKLEVRGIVRAYFLSAVLAFLAFVLALAGIFILSQAAAIALGQYLDSPVWGNVLVGLVLVCGASAMVWAALRNSRLTAPLRSRIFRWLLETAPAGGESRERN